MRCIDADDMLSIREKYTLVLLDESIIFIMIPANFKEVDEELLIVDTLGMKHFLSTLYSFTLFTDIDACNIYGILNLCESISAVKCNWKA